MVLNNYTEAELNLYRTPAFSDLFLVVFYSQEIGENGTPHLQGYCELKHPATSTGLQKKISSLGIKSRWALKYANGDRRSNLLYCTKSGPLVFSVPSTTEDILNFSNSNIRNPSRNHRQQRKEEMIQSITAGASSSEIAREYPEFYLQSSSGIDKLSMHFQPKRQWMTIGYWLSGPTGAGKSRWAYQQFPDAYYKDPETDWWDGYQGQETVIVDDYRPSKHLSFAKLLRMVDRYPLIVQVKGATTQFLAKRIIFTSPYPLLETFSRCDWLKDEELDQLSRRFPHQLHFLPGSITCYLTKNPILNPPVES